MVMKIETGRRDWRRTVTWQGPEPVEPYAPEFSMVCASVQVAGSGSATLEASNDGVTWTTMKDIAGNDMALTAPAYAEFSSGAKYVRPSAVGSAIILLTHWAN